MNEYQLEVRRTLEALFEAAKYSRGRVLDAGAVRRICSYIQNLARVIEIKDVALLGADNMLAAYVNEYGEELMDELLKEEDIVEGIVDPDGFEYEETLGLDSEEPGVDASSEGEEE